MKPASMIAAPGFRASAEGWMAENVPLSELAETFPTPFYVYSKRRIVDNFQRFDSAFEAWPHLTCYAMKANSSLTVLRLLARAGAGVDIVSGGELYRAARAGFRSERVSYSGVGKTEEEIEAALNRKIHSFNVESIEELFAIDRVAERLGVEAPVALRVNPDVDASTHHHITTGKKENKFGIPLDMIEDAFRIANGLDHVSVRGIHAHVGSQIVSVAPFVKTLKTLLRITDRLAGGGIHLRFLNLGGGLGIRYHTEAPPDPRALAKALLAEMKGRELRLLFEPGRFIVGDAGILVTRTLYRKDTGHKHFVVVDAAMNDLARPALYDAHHEIISIHPAGKRPEKTVDVVGPICESGDYLARGRRMPVPEQGEFLAVLNAGAYGYAMSSQYNSRPRVAEILVDGAKWHLIRDRETVKDLVRGERIPSEYQ